MRDQDQRRKSIRFSERLCSRCRRGRLSAQSRPAHRRGRAGPLATTLLALADLAQAALATTITWAIRTGVLARAYGGETSTRCPPSAPGCTSWSAPGGSGCSPGSSRTPSTRDPTASTWSASNSPGPSRNGAPMWWSTPPASAPTTPSPPNHGWTSTHPWGPTRALAPLIDLNLHSCGTVPPLGVNELAPSRSRLLRHRRQGRWPASTFLLATGYEQARSVVAALAGDWGAARDVQLDLPETGVCSTNIGQGLATGISGGLLNAPLLEPAAAGACCG
jgi:hypothetical protein